MLQARFGVAREDGAKGKAFMASVAAALALVPVLALAPVPLPSILVVEAAAQRTPLIYRMTIALRSLFCYRRVIEPPA